MSNQGTQLSFHCLNVTVGKQCAANTCNVLVTLCKPTYSVKLLNAMNHKYLLTNTNNRWTKILFYTFKSNEQITFNVIYNKRFELSQES